MRHWLLALSITCLCSTVAAQEPSCPAAQNDAFDNIINHCAEQEPGSLCFGHETVSVVKRANAPQTQELRQPGDTMPINAIDWLSVSTEDHSYGAARAVFPAYPYDGLEAEPSALLAYGNVALFLPAPHLQPPLQDLAVAASRGAYLRAEPNTDSDIVKPIPVRVTVKVIGASSNLNWLRIYAAPDIIGWMSREVLTEPEQALPLLAAETDIVPLWLPWQAFDFRSGIADAPCADAPESGILLQTPKFISPRQFIVNGIRLRLSGSAWLQAQANSGTLIHVLDGLANVRANGVEHEVKSGFMTTVPLDTADGSGLTPADAPTEPVAYDYHALLNLPVHALIYDSRIRLNVYTVADPVPADGGNPLESLSPDDTCTISAGLDGANLRAHPDPQAPIIAVMAYRVSAKPIARSIGVDQLPWWKLADSVWIRINVTVFQGDCNKVPLLPVAS